MANTINVDVVTPFKAAFLHQLNPLGRAKVGMESAVHVPAEPMQSF